MDVRLPDGTIIQGVPDGMSKAELTAKLAKNGYDVSKLQDAASPPQKRSTPDPYGSYRATGEFARDLMAGGVRGAGSIGATLLAPMDAAENFIARTMGAPELQVPDRRKAMTAALGNMGADTDSTAFAFGKGGTEVLGTLGVGPGLANAAGQVLPKAIAALPWVQKFINAVGSGGMTTGGAAPLTTGAKVADMGARMAGGAVTGGASAGLVDPESAGTGAAIGGALPLGVKVVGTVANKAGAVFNRGAARREVVGKIVSELGDNAAQVAADIGTYYPKGAENIPLSAAAVTKNPVLAQMEQGSRIRSSPAWYDLDQRQAQAVFDNVLSATDEAAQLGARKAARSEAWREAWGKAQENIKPKLWVQRMTQFGDDLATAMKSADASNPEVLNVLKAIESEIDRVGPGFSPGHLQQIRANLQGKIQPTSPNVFKSAPRDNPAIISLKQELDDILNVSTGGKWQNVIEGYAKDSGKVAQAAAAGKVRSAYVDEATGRIRGVSADPSGDVAKVTQAGLGRAMDAARLPDGSLALSPQAANKLAATLDALRAQGIVQGMKRTATAGGGSDTMSNAVTSGLLDNSPSSLARVLQFARSIGRGRTDAEMAALLSNPDALAAALEGYMRQKAPNVLMQNLQRAVPATLADR